MIYVCQPHREEREIGRHDEVIEKKEQHKLRKEFIASVLMNLRSQLDNINIQEKDGSNTNLGVKYGSKESH